MDSSTSFLRRPTEAPWSTLKFVKVIGEGRFGTVWLCEDGRTGEQYACKKVLKVSLKDSLLHQHFLRQEVALLVSMVGKHPNVIELKYVFEDDEAIYLMMEFCDVGDLFTYVTSNSSKQRSGISSGLSENKAVLIFRQLAHAVLYCHRNGVVHRDIKLENVLLSNPLNSSVPQYYNSTSLPSPSLPKQPGTASDSRVLAKLADFGLAVRLAPGEKTVGTAGSRPYEAPEVILGQEYDMKADVWSLGVLLFGMLSCSMPFQGNGERQLTRQIIRGNVDMSHGAWSAVSAEAKDLIRAMLSVNPDERISMAEVVTHPWIKAASRRRPVVTTSLTELDFANVTSGAVSPGYFGSLTPTSPLFPMKSPFGGRRKKVASTSDLPSLYPCNKDEDDKDGKDNTCDEEDRNNHQRLDALGRAEKRSAGLFEINADQEDSDSSSRNTRSGNQEKENSLPPLPPKTPRGCAADAALGLSIVLPDEVAGGVETHSCKGKSSMWDSFRPALSPSRRKWRMGF